MYCLRVSRLATVDEDAYISLRYARNLLRGEGLVFNPSGERVEGITNLLWTLAAVVGSRLTGLGLPTMVITLSIICGALTLLTTYMFCIWLLVRCELSSGVSALLGVMAPLLLIWVPGFVFYSASGLETPLVALLLICGLWAIAYAKLVSYPALTLGSLILGAAFLTRPEAGLALGAAGAAVAVGCLLGEKKSSMGTAARRLLAVGLPGGGVVVAATLWRLSYYGAPVPNTAYAKSGAPEAMLQWGLPYLLGAATNTVLIFAWGVCVVAALLNRRFSTYSLAGLLLVPFWSTYVVYVGGDYMASYRLFVPLQPILLALAVASPPAILGSLMHLPRSRRNSLPQGSSLAAYGTSAVALVPVLALCALVSVQAPQAISAERASAADNARWTAYRHGAAEWFDENDPDALVAANVVGALGYYSEVPVLDMLGLNNEQIGRYGNVNPKEPPGHQASNGDYVLSREPEYIIPFGLKPSHQVGATEPYVMSDRELFRSRQFRRKYEPMQVQVDAGKYGEKQLSMFHRREVALRG